MVVAINLVQFGNFPIENVLIPIFEKIASVCKEHKFIIIHSAGLGHFSSNGNVEYVYVPSVLKSSYVGWFQYQKAVSSVIKSHKSDVFITPYIFSNLILKIKQVLLLGHAGNVVSKEYFLKASNSFFKKYILKGIEKSERIITSSVQWKKLLVEQLGKKEKNIAVVDSGVLSIENPMGIEEQFKEEHTSSEAFFLLIDPSIDNDKLIFVLKAFSGFKKRLKSHMKLVVFCPVHLVNSFENIVKAYKYKGDVVFVNDELNKFISSSYATIYNSKYSGFDNISLRISRLKSVGIFVESGFNNSVKSLVYRDGDINSLSDQMMRIYKDEGLRIRMVEGNEKVEKEWDLKGLRELYFK